MPMGNVGETVSGMFGDLKSKLGFDKGEDRYDDYDEYGEYDDYDEYAEYSDEFKEDEPVGGYRPLMDNVSRSNRYARTDISSSLVSIDDVKMSTPLPDLSGYDTSAYDGAYVPPSTTLASGAGTVAAAGASASYDPYVAYSSANPSTHTPTRSLTVIKPMSYDDVERVARAVKIGDVVVLAMRTTPDDLSKRILDFSFGVASALDANVECPGEKVFAIARGNGLTDEEKRRLGVQGVL